MFSLAIDTNTNQAEAVTAASFLYARRMGSNAGNTVSLAVRCVR